MQFNDDDIQFLGGTAPQPTIRKGEDMTPSLANKKKFFSGHAFFSVLAMSENYVMIGEYGHTIYITY